MIRVAYFGTSAFAVPLLEALLQDARFSVEVVVTQPDRPVGRKHVLTPTPVKLAAGAHNVPALTPERMRDTEAVAALKAYAFDVAIVASYGQILSQEVLDLAPERFINLHGSLLPAYRGASPIAEAIKQGDQTTGVTVMLMDAKMDHGPVLSLHSLAIHPTDTTETLSARLAELGKEALPETAVQYLAGAITPQEQDHAQATFCKLLKKEDGFVDPLTLSAHQLERLVRAYTPWPNVTLTLHGTRAKILRAHVGEPTHSSCAVACNEGTLIIDELCPEGGKAMSGEAFMRGRRFVTNV